VRPRGSLGHRPPAMARSMHWGRGEVSHEMRRLLPMMMIGVLGVPHGASAAYRWFGTQLQCDVGSTRIVVGTQAAEEAPPAASLPTQSFHGGVGFPHDDAASRGPFEIDLQDFATDPSLCRRIGTRRIATDLKLERRRSMRVRW
jgi:hypothetical protein